MKDKIKNIEFGIIVSMILVLMAMFGYVRLPSVIVVLLVTLLLPKLFTPFTWLWFRLGEGLNIVMGRVLLVLIYFLVVTPVGLLRRMTGMDMMRLHQFKKSTASVFSVCKKEYEISHLTKQY